MMEKMIAVLLLIGCGPTPVQPADASAGEVCSAGTACSESRAGERYCCMPAHKFSTCKQGSDGTWAFQVEEPTAQNFDKLYDPAECRPSQE